MIFDEPPLEEMPTDGEVALVLHVEARPERRDEVEHAVRDRVVRRVSAISERIRVDA